MAASSLIGSLTVSQGVNSELGQIQAQSALLSHHIVYFLLNEDNIRLNGYVTGNGHTAQFRRQMAQHHGLQDAMKALETSCKDLKTKYQAEIETEVAGLDIYDFQLHSSFQESCSNLMCDGIRWGRITALYFYASVLAKRLHKEGQSSKIESLIGWLTAFLNEHCSQWVLEHGGWGAIKGGVKVETQHRPAPKQDHKSSWLTYVGLGVAAGAIVGALTIR